MTLAALLDLARALPSSSAAGPLAIGVLDLLAEAAPCGLDEPWVDDHGIGVPNEWAVDYVTAEDVRHMARMLLRVADEAEAK